MISVRSVRFRLLAAINTAIVLLLGVFLILDYRQEIAHRVAEKHVALEEETKTLLPAVLRMRPHGEQAVQRYIDDVCGRMQDSSSPGHHIAVQMNGTVLQAVAHHRASTAIFEAMKRAAAAPAHRAQFDNEELVVGSTRQDGTTVYVSEYMSNIRHTARGQILRRLPRIVLLVVVTAIVVNLVFLRMAARPLRKLVEAVQRIAQGEFGLQTGPFRSEEFDHLAGAVNTMSTALAENERRRRNEMDRARNIQQQLLPGEVDVPGLRLAHFYRPAEDVAGDYYDIISLPSGACLVAVADVTGHGVPAALSATMLKAYLQDASEHHDDPSDILRYLNHRLTGVAQTENFATMFVAVVDSDRNTLRYASAGHDPGLLLRTDGGVTELSSTGLVLGILDDADWSTEALTVGLGDRLLLTTDGVTEAFSPAGELFGRERLADEFVASASQAIKECSKRIRHSIDEHCDTRVPTDDITLVVLEIAETPETVVKGTSPGEPGN